MKIIQDFNCVEKGDIILDVDGEPMGEVLGEIDCELSIWNMCGEESTLHLSEIEWNEKLNSFQRIDSQYPS